MTYNERKQACKDMRLTCMIFYTLWIISRQTQAPLNVTPRLTKRIKQATSLENHGMQTARKLGWKKLPCNNEVFVPKEKSLCIKMELEHNDKWKGTL